MMKRRRTLISVEVVSMRASDVVREWVDTYKPEGKNELKRKGKKISGRRGKNIYLRTGESLGTGGGSGDLNGTRCRGVMSPCCWTSLEASSLTGSTACQVACQVDRGKSPE